MPDAKAGQKEKDKSNYMLSVALQDLAYFSSANSIRLLILLLH
jgi:hypothetical protein